jgi:hypothetical protein
MAGLLDIVNQSGRGWFVAYDHSPLATSYNVINVKGVRHNRRLSRADRGCRGVDRLAILDPTSASTPLPTAADISTPTWGKAISRRQKGNNALNGPRTMRPQVEGDTAGEDRACARKGHHIVERFGAY